MPATPVWICTRLLTSPFPQANADWSGQASPSPGTEGQVRPRSGLALKHGVTVLNSPGTIDEGYRGELGVILINHGRAAFEVHHGMKVAQLVVQSRLALEVVETTGLSDTQRGSGGFGSTGA